MRVKDISGLASLSWQVIARLSLLTVLLASLPARATSLVEDVRVSPSPERTRVVFDLTHPVEHTVFMLENPRRLVLDIASARMDANVDGLNLRGTPIVSMRSSARDKSNLRVVFDLSEAVKPRSFLLRPIVQYGDRLVIDLYTDAQLAPVVQKVDQITNQMRDVVVAIDAGHGGDDPGAVGHGSLYEKDVVLAISRELANLFEHESGYKPFMVRKDDYYIALRDRPIIARNSQADVFLSIHADAFHTAQANGASVYAISHKGATSEAARWLAEKENRADLIGGVGSVSLDDKDDLLAGVLLDLSLNASLSMSLEMGKSVLASIAPVNRLHKKAVEQASFIVLKSPDIPSLLIETGYISNPQESSRLATRGHQQKMARAIFTGVKRYLDDNPPAGTYLAWKRRGGDGSQLSYRIVRGDTLSSIASRYQVSADSLKQANGLRSDIIRIGQVLQIPSS